MNKQISPDSGITSGVSLSDALALSEELGNCVDGQRVLRMEIKELKADNERLTAIVAKLTANLETAVGALETGEMPF